jgi:hypothetical protein
MVHQPTRRVVRLNKHELTEMPAPWSNRERGQYLRMLLRFKGIDPDRLYQVDYYPRRHCWLLTQETEANPTPPPSVSTPPGPGDEVFYVQAQAELRRAASTAFAALAAHSRHFASFGCDYRLPPRPQEVTPADLVHQMGAPDQRDAAVRFDSEGGWQAGPSPS